MARGRKKADLTEEQVETGKRFASARPSSVTQEAAASAVGVHRVTISRYESGVHLPEAEVLLALCKLYGKPPEELGLQIVQGHVVRTTVVTTEQNQREDDPVQDALLGRYVKIPVWPSVGVGVWEMISGDGDGRSPLNLPAALTQRMPCVGLEVGQDDHTLLPTAAPGEVIVVGLKSNIPPGYWTVFASGNQVAVRGKLPDGRLVPIRPAGELVPLNPDFWNPIGIVLGVAKDVTSGRIHVDFEVGGFRYR